MVGRTAPLWNSRARSSAAEASATAAAGRMGLAGCPVRVAASVDFGQPNVCVILRCRLQSLTEYVASATLQVARGTQHCVSEPCDRPRDTHRPIRPRTTDRPTVPMEARESGWLTLKWRRPSARGLAALTSVNAKRRPGSCVCGYSLVSAPPLPLRETPDSGS